MNPWDTRTIRQYDANGVFPALAANSSAGMNRQGVCIAMTNRGIPTGEMSETLRAGSHGALPIVAYDAYQHHGWREGKTLGTLTTAGGSIRGDTPLVVAMDCRNLKGNEEISGTLQAKNQGGYSLNYNNPVVYSVQGNVIDRDAAQNGCGWAEGHAHTVNATDRHAVVYDARGNGNGGGGTDIDR